MHAGIVGVVLAGGRSTRMGGADKTLLKVAGKPLIAHAIGRLTGSVEALAINANGDPDRYAVFGVPVLADPVPGHQGPLAGVLAGLAWARTKDADAVVTAAGDTPFFPDDLVTRLVRSMERRPGRIILAASGQDLHPTFGLWPAALHDELAAHLGTEGDRSVLGFARTHGFVICDFPLRENPGATLDPFMNVNTPEDLETAEALYRGVRS